MGRPRRAHAQVQSITVNLEPGAPAPVADPAAYARVMRQVRQVWADPVAEIWMWSSNAHLGGARPADLLTVGDEQAVLDALAAHAAGSYA